MRKLFLAIWGINTVALLWVFGAILFTAARLTAEA
jgi:hypothetical protein